MRRADRLFHITHELDSKRYLTAQEMKYEQDGTLSMVSWA